MNETGQAQLRCVKGRREWRPGRRLSPVEWRAEGGLHVAWRPREVDMSLPCMHAAKPVVTAS